MSDERREEGASAHAPIVDPSRVAQCFDAGADAYEEVVWRNRQGAERLVAALPELGFEDVLDVGCGTGFASIALLARFAPRSITGVDASSEMLERFVERLGGRAGLSVTTHRADVVSMPVEPASMDLVLTSMAFHWFPDSAGAMETMARALRRGGLLALLTGGDGTEEEFLQLLRSLDPDVPAALTAIYAPGAGRLDEMERLLRGTGLEPIDIWMERRRRVVRPERFLERTRLVAGHLIADLPPAAQEATWARIGEALVASSEHGGFVYHFNKLFAIARRG